MAEMGSWILEYISELSEGVVVAIELFIVGFVGGVLRLHRSGHGWCASSPSWLEVFLTGSTDAPSRDESREPKRSLGRLEVLRSRKRM
jgi:hypothetical protein